MPGQTSQSPSRSSYPLAAVSGATVATILVVIFIVRDLAHQPVLVTSLASSTFLLYYQPLNEMNRLRPLVLGHLLSCVTGFVASLVLPVPYLSAAVSIAVSVTAMTLLRIAYPPAVSTSLIFSYRPHDVSALLTFLLTLLVVAVLAFLYFVLVHGIRPSRVARWFGFPEETRPPGESNDRQNPRVHG